MYAKLVQVKEYTGYADTPEAMCPNDHIFRTLICPNGCSEKKLGCQRMTDNLNHYTYKSLSVIESISCPVWWTCQKHVTCPRDHVMQGITCKGWFCRGVDAYCTALSSPSGPPTLGQCYWTQSINRLTVFKECKAGYVVTGISCSGWLCAEHKIQCCELHQVNQKCVMSSWGSWGPCSKGYQLRHRSIIKPQIGEGSICPKSEDKQRCAACQYSAWGNWSKCANGRRIRQRHVTKYPVGSMPSCGNLQETKPCRSCLVSNWSAWSRCQRGHQFRQRYIVQQPENDTCPMLKQFRTC